MAAPPTRRKISAVDTAWLRMDRPHNVMMISGVLMFRERLEIAALRRVVDERSATTDCPALATDRLFVSPTGKPILDHTLWRIISRARESAQLPHFRPYDLRHSHASLLIELGAHPKAISERMGHTEIGVTMNVYGHLFNGAQHALTNDLDELVNRSR